MRKLLIYISVVIVAIGLSLTAQNSPPYPWQNIGIQSGGYVNFGSAWGSSGYGFRDSAGTIQYKNSGGSWAAMASYTDATIRALFSSTATGLTYTNTTGVFSLTTGYVIPTTVEQTKWNTLTPTANATGYSLAGGTTPKTLTVSGDATVNQSVATTSSPAFANLTDSGLTATRIPYAGTAGLLGDYAGLAYSTSTGFYLGSGLQLLNYGTQAFFIGDSLTSHTHSNRMYPSRIMDTLGRGWRVINKGTGGNLTAQMVTRFAADVTALARAGDYVIIWGGVNDAINDVAAATTEANLQTMYTAAQAAGMKVIALTIAPWKNYSSWSSGRQALTDAVNAWIMSATPTGINYKIDMFTLMENSAGDDLFNVTYCDVDLLHPNEAGLDWIGDFVYAGATWTAAPGLNATTHVRTSSAEQSGTYFDLRFGLDANGYDVFFMPASAMSKTLAYTVSTTPTVHIVDVSTYTNRMDINYNSLKGGPYQRGTITFPETNGYGFTFQRAYADQNASDVFTFNSASSIETTDSDAVQAFMKLAWKNNQTATATGYGIWLDLTPTGMGDGSTGYGNNYLVFSTSAVAHYRVDTSGFYTMSGTTGGQTRGYAEATANITANHTITITLNVPAGAKILGCQLRVDSALATGETWNAAYVTGNAQTIAHEEAVAANTKIDVPFDGLNTGGTLAAQAAWAAPICTAATNIVIQKHSSPGVDAFTAQGTIRAIVYYETKTVMASL